jgi:hypothetical protein
MTDQKEVGPYEVAGHDLETLVAGWLRKVNDPDAKFRRLLDHVDEEYDYGGSFIMGDIASDGSDEGASEETMAFYAIIAVYQSDSFPGSGCWQGEAAHLWRAFTYARSLGATEVASNLLQRIAERSTRVPDPMLERLRARPLGNDPSKRAAHDREMASIVHRDIRAARLLDSSLSIDDFIITPGGNHPNHIV